VAASGRTRWVRQRPGHAFDEALRGRVADFVVEQMFGAAVVEHMQRYGNTSEHFAKIGEKNHRHSVNNPYAQFQDEYTLDEVKAAKAAKMIYVPAELTRLQCSRTSDRSGAVIVASEAFVDKHGLAAQAVEIVGQAMVTDLGSTFSDKSAIIIVGADLTRNAARQVYDQGRCRGVMSVSSVGKAIREIPATYSRNPSRSAISTELHHDP
jgi:acetyl-CoA acetyltransferase